MTSVEPLGPEIETRFIKANGLTFETLVANPGADKFALLLHGFPEHAISWRFQIPLLANLGYEVWVPNQRGYGASSSPAGVDAYRVEHLVGDVAALVDAGAQGRPVTLMAHDWGAIVAWAFAEGQVRPLDRLVIMNVPHPIVMMEGLRTLRQLLKSWYVFFFQLPWLPEALLRANDARAIENAFLTKLADRSSFTPEVLAVYRNNALRPGGLTAMINWYRAAFKGARRTRASAVEIQTPTLMIWGEADVALGVELTQGYEGLVKDLTLHRLPGVSHWVQQEAPQKVNPILQDWLGRTIPA
jgi:epoxide hydrolase 4